MFGLVPFRRNGELTKTGDYGFKSLIDEFFNDPFFNFGLVNVNSMKTDIKETEDEYIIEADIPGAKKEDIKIELNDNLLTISYEQKKETKEEKENYLRKERMYGSYCRSFSVDNVKDDEITAKYENGVLTLVLPKKEKQLPNKKNITIN